MTKDLMTVPKRQHKSHLQVIWHVIRFFYPDNAISSKFESNSGFNTVQQISKRSSVMQPESRRLTP